MVDNLPCSNRELLEKFYNEFRDHRADVEAMIKYSSNMISPRMMLLILGAVVLAFAGAKGLDLLTIWSTKLPGVS